MTTDKSGPRLKPSWMVILGVILVLLSYVLSGAAPLVITILQVSGIVLVIFGIILWSAQFNSKRKL
jgi:uncharacterized membrane protein HdeD (DUF308 family)